MSETIEGAKRNQSLGPNTTNLDMEVVMTNYSELVVLLFIIPVVMHIIIPLLMLASFSIVSGLKTVFRQLKFGNCLKSDLKVGKEMQLSRP